MTFAVAIAVVSWNTRDLLAAALHSMEGEARCGRAEVWVVDNASHDGSADLVRESFPWARLHACPTNLGFGAAVNLVAERTATPWIAGANADVALTPGTLEALLEAGRRDPGAAALAPRLRLPDGSTQSSVHPFPTVALALTLNTGAARLSPRLAEHLCLHGAWDPEVPRRVPWAMGAFLMVRRSAWEQVGGFDGGQWMYAEDLDLGWRLARAGWATRYEPRALVRHQSAAATRQAWTDAEVRKSWSAYAWMLRRRGPALTRLVAAIQVAGCGTRWWAAMLLCAHDARRWAPRRAWWRRWTRMHAVGLRSRRALEAHR